MTRTLLVTKSLGYGFSIFVGISFLSVARAQVAGPQAVAGEYIVKMKVRTGETANGSLNTGMKMFKRMGAGVQVKQAFAGSSMMHIKASSQSAIEALKSDPNVEYVEPNYLLSINPQDVRTAGVAPSNSDTYSQSYSNVKVVEAWAIEKPYNQGSKIIVAVIDTGLDITHHLFSDSNSVWVNSAELAGLPGVDDDGNGYVDDAYGWNYVANSGSMYDDDNHGTHVAGIILGVGQDVLASPVRESKIKIMPLKFLDANGSGSTANAISAMYYAVKMGAKVINNSWGGSTYSRSLHEAYTYAYDRGVVVASAAGNSGANTDFYPMYPGSLDTPNNISVAATTDADNKASFSNFGSTVSVAAPGVGIISSVPGVGCPLPGCFQMMSGTSMASPFVAGLAALVFREAPQLSAYQVKSIILAGIDSFASLSGRVSTSGRVNVLKTIQSAKTQTSTVAWAPSYTPVYKTERAPASTDSAPKAGGCGLIKAILDESSNGSGPTNGGMGSAAVVLLMVLLPMALAASLRSKNKLSVTDQRRQYARYNVAKNLVIEVGGQFINAASDSLSLGGLSFGVNQSQMKIDKGEKIKVKIGGLDEEVVGEVVWCSQKQSYGVRFLEITDQLRAQMLMWTNGLQPT
ncbi:MAG: S8 family serine peptidase [Bdellovibrionaceae bacterium]|nr:S8 family serine peptidase [Bdellovibrio sp.]